MTAIWIAGLLALGLGAQADAPSVTLSDLDAVKSLYAQASYDETLQRISTMPAVAITAPIEEYRALSLLALGRTADADQAFERLVRQAPQYHINENDVSPRIATMFTDVRRRVLPAVAREMYAEGKSSYDQKHYAEASERLKALLALLADPDMAGSAASVDDLKQLADGFLRLSELDVDLAAREARDAAREAAAAAPPAAPAPAGPPPTVVSKIVIYAAGDSGVTPPVEIERHMPAWNPPAIMARNAEFRGELEVVVDESGNVESAVVRRPTVEAYDLTLVDAARRWRYKPAILNNQTVKYRLVYAIVISPKR